jgi:hypothetical protein
MKIKHIIFALAVSIAVAGCGNKTTSISSSISSAVEGKLSTLVGVRDAKGVIQATGKSGYLVFGPYMPLGPGRYSLVAKGVLSGPGQQVGTIDVSMKAGSQILISKPIQPSAGGNAGELATLEFKLDAPATDVEFRILVQDQVTGSFTGYELTALD